MNAVLWLPGTIHKRIPKTQSDPFIVPVGAVFHVAVTEASSLFDYFAHRSGGIESTGYIRRDGSTEQYRAVNIQCDAQSAGNSWQEGSRLVGLTSWESQGMGSGTWTDAQINRIKFIISWLVQNKRVPARVCPNPRSAGFGIHNMFTAWNPDNHSCPGPERTAQWHDIIVPFIRSGTEGDWFDMVDEATLRQIIRQEVGNAEIVTDPKGKGVKDDVKRPLNAVLRALLNDEAHIKSAISGASDKITKQILGRLTTNTGTTFTLDQVQQAVEAGIRDVLGGLDNTVP